MEDPFVLQVVHLQDYYTKKIKELDEKSYAFRIATHVVKV